MALATGGAAAAAAPESSTNTLAWWAHEVGIAGVARGRTEDVVRLLVASPELLHNPAELSRVARQHGHPMMPPAAAKFAERVLLDEAAFALLQSRRYKEFLRGLHTPAPRPRGGADLSAEAEAAAAAIEDDDVSLHPHPPPLAAVGAGRSLIVEPAVKPAPPRTPRQRRQPAAAAPVDATPEGGETAVQRSRRKSRKRQRKRRKDNEALRVKEADEEAARRKKRKG